MSVGIRSRIFPSLSTPHIDEPASKDVTASLHRNVLSWGVWRGQEAKESVSPRAVAQSSYCQGTDIKSFGRVSNLFRTASVPDVAGKRPQTSFSSITIAARKVFSTSQEYLYPSTPVRPLRLSTHPEQQENFGRKVLSISSMSDSNPQPGVCRRNTTILTPNESRRAYSPADGLRCSEKKRAQLLHQRYPEEDRKEKVIGGSVMNLFALRPSYRSCIHHEVPLRSNSSVVFLDKSLCISLAELEGRRAGQPPLYTSTLSVRLSVSSCHRFSRDHKIAKTNEGFGRRRAATLGSKNHNGRDSSLGHCRGPLLKNLGEVDQTAPTHGVNNKADDSNTHGLGSTSGLLSFKGPSSTKKNRNADEAVISVRSNFRHRKHTLSSGQVDSRTKGKQAGTDKTAEGQKDGCSKERETVSTSDTTCCYHSKLQASALEGTPKTLSLKEALELFRPDFICRSQGRVRRLEQRARRRKALQDSNPDLVQGLGEDRGKQKRKCTTPDPLSDNLFKPRERTISGREMQLRSRRIYNKLPEVTKKKEEEKKRAVSQSNRLRAEVFKKRLLDQILQR
ncbi:uncharacterized protein LOC125018474 isoform X2 [Mugil cephalus]|uniref:uncharacterized protein LOC125018474 isoform X2 n=1 Tax=Mugil cephalus TaxID=48193 RepID=UPI001FB5E06B|nr:uncharacterized protein LOC125018474 isoform X2 [Mugil cephalus]